MKYKKISEVPITEASLKEWQKRGYKKVKGRTVKPSGYVSAWNGMYYLNFSLYSFGDVEIITGDKARNRRIKFWRENYEKIGEFFL